MAESAPLSSAHGHARKAAEELQKVHFLEAAQEHQQASNDFSRAAKCTSDVEALRVLKLLEEQHQRLARIVKSQDTPTTPEPPPVEESKSQSTTKDASSTTSPPPEKASKKTPSLTSTRIGNSQARDSSPSLARDMATRRGIPQPSGGGGGSSRTQPSPAAQARQELSPESSRRRPSSKIPASIIPSSQAAAATTKHTKDNEDDDDDEGFTNFYTNLTTGTMSKLSSVLAYAGLPLTTTTKDPDVKKLFSKAALEAGHREQHFFAGGGPSESFYYVPGTLSYAEMARQQQQDDEATKEQKRSSSTNTQEELELENATLKQTLERVASRLNAFEAHAQDASMAALMTQSTVNPGGGGQDAGRLAQLEREVEELEGVKAGQERELRRHRQRWEELKKGAREKARAKKREEGTGAAE